MTTNPSPEFGAAQKKYLAAQGKEEQLECLEEMIRTMPQHKSAEALRANLRTRYKKLRESLEKSKKSGKSSKAGIKKADMQALILGFPNSGKSSLFKLLTNQDVKIHPTPFTTYVPVLGTTDYEDIKIQLIDSPPFPNEDKSIINSTDTILLVIDSLEQIKESEKYLNKTPAKIIVIFNKSDLLNENEERKIQATLKSKYKNFNSIVFSSEHPKKEQINELKKRIFETFPIIRIYTKEPKKEISKIPMILKKDSTIKQAAEKISKGILSNIKRIRIWGPSSKFSGQIVGIDHILKDKDAVEFQTS